MATISFMISFVPPPRPFNDRPARIRRSRPDPSGGAGAHTSTEEALLGALIYDPSLAGDVPYPAPSHFENLDHQAIYEAFLDLHAAAGKVSVIADHTTLQHLAQQERSLIRGTMTTPLLNPPTIQAGLDGREMRRQ